ncbi:MAG TPA: hypothetical protein EYQ08_11005 [Planctomycetes bacterium]|nr:hypothetical protein [Planctomycetota bacterium]HIK81351.1 hypothetical protein [Planctomycetota bacterium]
MNIEHFRSATTILGRVVLLALLAIATPCSAQFNPSVTTSFDNLQAGAASSFSQTLLFPEGSEGPYSLLIQFNEDTFDFSGFVPGQQVGGAVIDIFIQTPVVTVAGQIIAEVQINTVDLETLEAVAMVTEITGNVAAGLALLGFPNPTGQIAFNVTYTKLPVVGATMNIVDAGSLPLSGILDFDVPLVWTTEPLLNHSPAGGVLVVETTITSSSGVTMQFEELFPLSDPLGAQFQRADCNADGSFNIADTIFTLASLFSGGWAGTCTDACDSNDDGSVNIADAVFSLAALFNGGTLPAAPSPGTCGWDENDTDTLDCESFGSC